jgi:hypothetical protein
VIIFFDVGLAWDTHLEHVKKGRLASVIKTQEQQLGVLVQQAEAGEDIVDYSESTPANVSLRCPDDATQRRRGTYTS